MNITDSEMKTDFDEPLESAAKKDICIKQSSAVDFLCGLIKDAPCDLDLNSLRDERISRKKYC